MPRPRKKLLSSRISDLLRVESGFSRRLLVPRPSHVCVRRGVAKGKARGVAFLGGESHVLSYGFWKKGGEKSVRTDPGGLARSASVGSCTGAGFLPFSCSLAGHRPVLVRVRRGFLGGENPKDVARS